jgi:DNA-binding transcriptional ArsR family regulator
MRGDADLAALGTVLADGSRARMLLALGDGRALPASVLAAEAGVAASTASGHLSRLVDAGLLSVRVEGRHRYYRLAGPHVGELLEALARVAPLRPCAHCARARVRTPCAPRARATTTSRAGSASSSSGRCWTRARSPAATGSTWSGAQAPTGCRPRGATSTTG